MARKTKNPVVVTMSKASGERVLNLFGRGKVFDGEWAVFNVVAGQVDDQCGPAVVLTLSLKDAKAIHAMALRDQQRTVPCMSDKAYTVIEKAFRKAYDARLRASVGE